MLPGRKGRAAIVRMRPTLPKSTKVMGKSRSVRFCAMPAAPSLKDARLSWKAETMVGSVLSSVMKPPAATAPAPICRT
jgi:hypothetical protein